MFAFQRFVKLFEATDSPSHLSATVALVELLRSDWIGGGLASLAWLVFVQVERRRAPLKPPS